MGVGQWQRRGSRSCPKQTQGRRSWAPAEGAVLLAGVRRLSQMGGVRSTGIPIGRSPLAASGVWRPDTALRVESRHRGSPRGCQLPSVPVGQRRYPFRCVLGDLSVRPEGRRHCREWQCQSVRRCPTFAPGARLTARLVAANGKAMPRFAGAVVPGARVLFALQARDSPFGTQSLRHGGCHGVRLGDRARPHSETPLLMKLGQPETCTSTASGMEQPTCSRHLTSSTERRSDKNCASTGRRLAEFLRFRDHAADSARTGRRLSRRTTTRPGRRADSPFCYGSPVLDHQLRADLYSMDECSGVLPWRVHAQAAEASKPQFRWRMGVCEPPLHRTARVQQSSVLRVNR